MKQKYGDKLTIRTGIEFGVQKHTLPVYERISAEREFGFYAVLYV